MAVLAFLGDARTTARENRPPRRLRVYCGSVSRKPDRHKSFADIVPEVREQPTDGEPERNGVTDPEGTRWRPSTSSTDKRRRLPF